MYNYKLVHCRHIYRPILYIEHQLYRSLNIAFLIRLGSIPYVTLYKSLNFYIL